MERCHRSSYFSQAGTELINPSWKIRASLKYRALSVREQRAGLECRCINNAVIKPQTDKDPVQLRLVLNPDPLFQLISPPDRKKKRLDFFRSLLEIYHFKWTHGYLGWVWVNVHWYPVQVQTHIYSHTLWTISFSALRTRIMHNSSSFSTLIKIRQFHSQWHSFIP